MAQAWTYLAGPLLVAALVGAIAWIRGGRRARAGRIAGLRVGAHGAALPPWLRVPRVNDDLCIGCEKCIAICPMAVLDLVRHKSQVARLEDCISCQKCAEVCPTQALIMYAGGTRPTRDIVLPDLDTYYQSRRVPGLYLIGEAAGKPLVKNAVNLGRAVVEHMRLAGGLAAGGAARAALDVVIIGAGPAGLSAAMSCAAHGLRYVVLERSGSAMSTVMRYPQGKAVHAEPHDVRCVGLLPVWDCTTLALRAEWNRILDAARLNLVLDTEAVEVRPEGAAFVVVTRSLGSNTAGASYQAARVIVAIGGLGVPRRLGRDHEIPGENLAHVRTSLDDAGRYRQRKILVIGGGDSAVEAALDLACPELENRVMVSYYKQEAHLSCNPTNLQRLRDAVAQDRILPLYESRVRWFARASTCVQLARPEPRDKEIPTDAAFVLIGGDPPKTWLQRIGIDYAPVNHGTFRRPPTDQLVERLLGPLGDNNQPGRPLALPGSANSRTTIIDAGVTLLDRPAAPQASTAADEQPTELIKLVPEQRRFRLPERARPEGEHKTVRQVLEVTRIARYRAARPPGQRS